MILGLLLPFEHLNVPLGPFLITPAKTSAAILFFIAGLQWVMERRPPLQDPARPWIVALAVSVAVSAAVSLALGTPAISVLTLCITWFSVLFLYVALTYTMRSRREFDLLVMAAGVGSMIVVLSAFAGIGYQTESEHGQRMGGLGGNVNELGSNLCLLIPLVAALFLSRRSLPWKAFFAAILAVQVAGLFATLSRSAYAAAAAMVAVWLWRTGSQGVVKYGVPTLAVAGVALAVAPESFYSRLESLNPWSSGPRGIRDSALVESLESRISYQLPNAVGMFASNPLTGRGLNRTIPWSIEEGTGYRNVIHNSYLEVAAEQGLLGLVPFVAIQVLLWRRMGSVRRGMRLRSLRGDGEFRQLYLRATMLQIAFVGVVVNAQTHTTARFKLIWVLFAMSPILYDLARKRFNQVDPAASTPSRTPWRSSEPTHSPSGVPSAGV